MPKLLPLLLALLSVSAQAEVIATSPTTAEGEIRLTDEPCDGKRGMYFMFITVPGGNYYTGCWKLVDGDVYAVLENGVQKIYSSAGFTVRKPARARRGEAL